jgi:sugar fermentation stimulation protein A
MLIQGPLTHAVFVRRPNRFLAICRVDGHDAQCYLPNPGPMPDILHPGSEVLVRFGPNSTRRTKYDLIGVRHRGVMISLDSRVPNYLIAEALGARILPPFVEYDKVCTEPTFESGRFDFLLQSPTAPSCYVETKSSTHVEQDIAFFPRAVTLRGQRHLHELVHVVKHGLRAAMVFLVQRTDARSLRPNDRVDPVFGAALREAREKGVEIYAWTSSIDEETCRIELSSVLTVDLSTSDLF